MIKIQYNTINKFHKPCNAWYRVYKIKEYDNKPYAILLLVGNDDGFHVNGMLFDAIENLSIPNLKENDCLAEDMDENRDLNKLFKGKNSFLCKYYGNIENLLKANIRPQGLFAFRISFYFSLRYEEIIKQSFEEFFSMPLEYTKCSSFEMLEEQEYGKTMLLPKKNDEGTLKPNPLKENERPKYGVCNILLNANAFIEWVVLKYNYYQNFDDLIHITSPSFINKDIARYYYDHLLKQLNNLKTEDKENLISKLKENKEGDEINE